MIQRKLNFYNIAHFILRVFSNAKTNRDYTLFEFCILKVLLLNGEVNQVEIVQLMFKMVGGGGGG